MPPWASSKRPGLGRNRPGESSPLVSEQLALQQVGRDRGAVHFHEGVARPRTAVVKRARQQLLAGPGFPTDQNREIAQGCDPCRLIEGLAQCRTHPEDGLEPGGAALRIGEPAGLDPAGRFPGQPLQAAPEQVQIVGQREVVPRAALNRGRRNAVIGRGADQVAGCRRGRLGEPVERLAFRSAGQDENHIGRAGCVAAGGDRVPGLSPELLDDSGHGRPEAVREQDQPHAPLGFGHALVRDRLIPV